MECFKPSFSDMPMPPRIARLAIVNTGPEWLVMRMIRSETACCSWNSGTSRLISPKSERTFRSYRLTGQHQLQSHLRPNKERQDRRSERRKHANRNFRLRKSGLRSGNHEIAKSRKLRSAPDGRPVHHANNGFTGLQHSRESPVKRIQHLKYALRSVFANINPAAKYFARGIENDQFHVFAVARKPHPSAISRSMASFNRLCSGLFSVSPRDAAFHLKFDVLEFVGRPPKPFCGILFACQLVRSFVLPVLRLSRYL